MDIVTSDEYRGVVFSFNNNELLIRAANPNIGESKEKIKIKFNREPFEVAFNPKYFIDALNFIESDKARLNIIDGEHPCVIHGDTESTHLNIIMPMKI